MLKVGTEVRGYRIEGVLGHGGMGIVYEARQISLDRLVALKVLSPELSSDTSFRQRFRREGQIQAAIDHPHIVTVHEAGEIEEGLFIAMRIVRGPTLKDMIIARELEAARTLRILSPIADALDAAHSGGLIHRDVKPQNILVGARDHPYLADFGLTKGANESGLTRTGQFVGTIDYISPEQIRGEPAQPASDIYALAAVLYECLTGSVPYAKPSDAAVLFAHMSDPRPLVTEKRPDLPPALNDVIVRGMDLNPANRHTSGLELVHDAERAFGRRIRAALTPPGPIELPEEVGIREQEGKVPTRETRIREAAELADASAAEATAPGATRPRGVEPAPPVGETVARAAEAPADATVARTADVTAPREAPADVTAARATEAPADVTAARATEAPADATAARATEAPADATVARDASLPDDAGDVGTVDGTVIKPVPAPVDPEPSAASSAAHAVQAPTAETEVAEAPRRETVPTRPHDREPAPAAPAAAARSRSAFVPVVLALAVVAIVVGFLVGNSGGGGSDDPPAAPAPLSSAVASADVGLNFPSTWRRAATPKTIAGLEFARPIGLEQTGAAGTGLVAGIVDGRGATLLPAAFVATLPSAPKPSDPVKLGSLAAYRYKNLKPKGGGQLTVFAVPTSVGVATVACYGPGAAECERIAGSLRLERGKAFALGADAAYGTGLGQAISTLNARRDTLRTRLAAAKTPAGQTAVAGDLSKAYTSAADAVAKLTPTPQVADANAAIVTALKGAASAYTRLGRAARAQDRAAYRTAGSRVGAQEEAVQSAVSALDALGYKVA